MRSIYVLSDYGVSLTILNNLYNGDISYLDVEFFDDMYLREKKITKRNIEIILKAMARAKNDKYQNSIQELRLFGLSNSYYYKAIQKNITFESLKLSEKEFCNKYEEKSKFYNALIEAYKKLENNNFNIINDDFSKYLLLMIKNKCEKKKKLTSTIYDEMKKTSYPIDYFYNDLNKLEECGVINVSNGEIEYVVPPLKNSIEKMSERTKKIIELRLSGMTLRDIGNKFGLTRERIRQIIEREYKRLPFVSEDKFQLYYEEYDFSEEEFCKIFLEPKQTYYYLFDKYDKGSKDFYEIENDYLLPREMVIRIKELKKEIYINNEFIVGNRDGILRYILKRVGSNIRVDNLFSAFNDALINEFNKYNILRFDSIHNLEALLERKTWSISGANKTFRYYEPKLVEKTDLEQVKEILLSNQGFYSTLYFFENNKELMEQIDIRNEQELHNFLRNYIHDSSIEYLRMPNVLINCQNKEEFILSMIYKYSPISLIDFCKLLRDSYGHREDTIASYLSLNFGKYITNGMISVDVRDLSYEESEKIMKNMDKAIYPIVEVEKLLEELDIKDGNKFLNNLNLNKLGYKIVGSFVVKKSFDKMEDALYKSIERGELEKNYVKTNSSSYACIWKLLKRKKVIELNNQYVPFEILYKLGITKEDVTDFENKIEDKFSNDNEYFTAYNIRENVDCNLLNKFSISDDIINGLVYSMDKFKKISWKDNIIYIKSSNGGSRMKFIESIIRDNCGISIKEIQLLLSKTYGIKVEENDIKNILYTINYTENDDKFYFNSEV